MSVAIVTGAAGLVGSESCRYFHGQGMDIVGLDNDMRAYFFGETASTRPTHERLRQELANYTNHAVDIRDEAGLETIFKRYGKAISLIVHTAAQPSHDWAAREPKTDFSINATGTLNLLEAMRAHAPDAAFIFTSTNKVYGDTPNALPLVETETRYTVAADHPFANGIDETMSIDATRHSIFGASKVAADVMVQEYGRYFGLNTACFRGGCLTGPAHSGAELHGFLSYLMKCTVAGKPYRIFGYKGKQVRDNIHSADLVTAFGAYAATPRPGAVYNIGGGTHANCSMREAIALCEDIAGRKLDWTYEETNRKGDHIWWVSDVGRFQRDYPDWRYTYDLRQTLEEIHAACVA